MKFSFLLLIVWFLVGCVKKPNETPQPAPQPAYKGVFILNEGQWGLNGSTISYYDENNGYQSVADVFSVVNGAKLGDTGNFILQDADTLYVVVNNSRMIYKIQMPSFKLIGKINLPDGSSPRMMLKISPNKAYINSLLDGIIYIINPVTMQLEANKIIVEKYPEAMVRVDNEVFITCGNYAPPAKNNKVAKVNSLNDNLLGYIELPIGNPGPIVFTNNKVHIACRDHNKHISCVSVINPSSFSIDTTLYLAGSLYDMKLINNNLYITNDSCITQLNLSNYKIIYNYFSRTELGAKTNDLIYGIAFDSLKNEWYINNAGYGAINGKCIILNAQKQIVRQLNTGVFPKEVFFYR